MIQLICFIISFIYSFLFFGSIWTVLVIYKLYVCTDPFSLGLDMIPSFVHSHEQGDKFLVNPAFVQHILEKYITIVMRY